MPQPKLLVTRKLPDAVEARIRRDYDALLNEQDVLYGAGRSRAPGPGQWTGSSPAARSAGRPRWWRGCPSGVGIIASFSVGYEHIDVPACRARGIVATNTPDVLTEATADVAMLCLLGAARRAWEGETMLREGRWRRANMTELLGLELRGRVLGIVGMGRIGQAVARRARGFGLIVHYHNRTALPADKAEGAIYHADARGPAAALPLPVAELPRRCRDPASDQRADPRPSSAGRGPGEHGPRHAGRRRGADRGAALRAGCSPPGSTCSPASPNIHPGYRDLPNCFLLPHLGSATVETRDAMGFRALDNLDAFFAGRARPGRPDVSRLATPRRTALAAGCRDGIRHRRRRPAGPRPTARAPRPSCRTPPIAPWRC